MNNPNSANSEDLNRIHTAESLENIAIQQANQRAVQPPVHRPNRLYIERAAQRAAQRAAESGYVSPEVRFRNFPFQQFGSSDSLADQQIIPLRVFRPAVQEFRCDITEFQPSVEYGLYGIMHLLVTGLPEYRGPRVEDDLGVQQAESARSDRIARRDKYCLLALIVLFSTLIFVVGHTNQIYDFLTKKKDFSN